LFIYNSFIVIYVVVAFRFYVVYVFLFIFLFGIFYLFKCDFDLKSCSAPIRFDEGYKALENKQITSKHVIHHCCHKR